MTGDTLSAPSLLVVALCACAVCFAGCTSPTSPPPDTGVMDTGAMDTEVMDAADARLDVEGSLDAIGSADMSVGDAGEAGLPETLSAAGLFEEGVSGAYAPGLRSYDVRFPLWTDGAEKRRHILLPEGAAIDVSDPDHWRFPVGTRIFKEFRVAGVTMETRLLWKRGEGDWLAISYVHRADGSDADAAADGASDVLGTDHDVPSQAQCQNCHQGGGDFVLGLGSVQLEGALLDAWAADGVLPVGTEPAAVPGTATEQAALGYLHANCGHCHNEIHPASRVRELRLWLPAGLASAVDAPAWETSVGARAFHELEGTDVIIVPGDAAMSQLFLRMENRDETQMPPLGTERADEEGLEAIRAWIER